MRKRIRLFGKKHRTTNEQFTSVGLYVKTRDLIRKGAREQKVPIYQYVHDVVMLAQNKPKGGTNGR